LRRSSTHSSSRGTVSDNHVDPAIILAIGSLKRRVIVIVSGAVLGRGPVIVIIVIVIIISVVVVVVVG
jgi:hypothetical protein